MKTYFINLMLRFRRDLRLQLLTLYILFVGPVMIAALFFGQSTNQRLQTDVKASDLSLARSIAQETELNMLNARRAVEELSEYEAVRNFDSAGMEEIFIHTLSVRQDISLVYRLNAQGFMIYHYPVGPVSTIGQDFSYWEYFQRAKVTSRSLISKGRISATTNQPVATAVMPIWDSNGEFQGVVATNIKLATLSQTLDKISSHYRYAGSFQVRITDSSGQIIADPDLDRLLTPATLYPLQVKDDVLLGRSGNFTGEAENREETLFSYAPIPSAGWGVIVSRPTASAFATARSFSRGVLAIVALFLGVGVLFWFGLSRQHIQPLEKLAEFSRAISRREALSYQQHKQLEALTDRQDQTGNLTSSLLRMERAIDARINELSTLLKTSTAVVSSLNQQTVLDRILEQVEHLMDVHMSAILAFDQQQGAFRAQASRGLPEQYTERILIDPNDPQSISLQAIRMQTPIQVSDTERDPSFRGSRTHAREAGYRSFIAIPLKTQYATPSVLLIFRRRPHIFSAGEIDLLTSFANNAAMAIENAELYNRSDIQLQEQTRRLQALIQSMHDGLILEDPTGKIIYANRRIMELTGFQLEDLQNAQAFEVIDRIMEYAQDKEETRQAILDAFSASQDSQIDFSIFYHGRQFHLRLVIFPVTDLDGVLIGRGQIYQDITADREVDTMKSRLISTVSHELRTPLAAIKGYVTTLLAKDVEWDARSQEEFLKIISDETDWLSDMVTNLLDLSKIEAGTLPMRLTNSNLGDIVALAAQRAYPKPGGPLQINLPQDLPTLEIDERLIEAVVRNLIENAVKYAGETSPIYIDAAIEGQQVVVRVLDEGPGIPAEADGEIFEQFYRPDDGRNRTIPGVGLGLSICRGFVEAHGGEIWVEPCQQGACIAFSIPLKTKIPIQKTTAKEQETVYE